MGNEGRNGTAHRGFERKDFMLGVLAPGHSVDMPLPTLPQNTGKTPPSGNKGLIGLT